MPLLYSLLSAQMEAKACLPFLHRHSQLSYVLWSPVCSSGGCQPFKLSMAVCMMAVCGRVGMKLHRVLLTGCMSCTRMYPPGGGSFSSKRLLTSVGPFSSRVGGTRTLTICTARTALYPLKYTVLLGNRKPGLCSRSYSDVGSQALCSQTLPVSRCQHRRSQPAAERKENLLQGAATWPGKTERQSAWILTTAALKRSLFTPECRFLWGFFLNVCCFYIVHF